MFYDKSAPYSLYTSLRKSVDETIARQLATVEPPELRQALMHGAFGGKRVRPIVTMLSSSAVGGEAYDALEAAAAIELLHTSSLVHDDIMDNADMRRGVPTIHSRYGKAMAILAGDTLIALAFQLMQSVYSPNREHILTRFTRAFLHTCEGQGFDLVIPRRESDAMAIHRLMVEKKTARLLEAAASIGAMLGTTNDDHIRALGLFGFDLGMAFQAKDDLLDQTGDEKTLGKPVQADLRNGKLTFVSLAAVDRDLRGSLPGLEVVDQVEELTRSACSALDALPPTPARESLKAFADALLVREH
jgi:geranylgeranyl diphosphate synthase, type I